MTKKVANTTAQVPIILGCPLLAITNSLISYANRITRLPFGSMTLDLNTFILQRQSFGFDDMEFSTLN